MAKYKFNFYDYTDDLIAVEIRGDLRIDSKINFQKFEKINSFETLTKEGLSCDCEFYSEIENYINRYPQNNIFVIDKITNMVKLSDKIIVPVVRIEKSYENEVIKNILTHYLSFLIDSRL